MRLDLKIFKVTLLLLLFSSCDNDMVYHVNRNIPDDSWDQNNIITFSPNIEDTISYHDIYVHIRHTGEYPMSNLFLYLHVTSPLGLTSKDIIECTLADEKGKWLGKGFGNIWSIKALYKKDVKFPYTGQYKFDIEQAMRIDELPGIIDVGLRIERKYKE